MSSAQDWLIDKSALARLGVSPDAAEWSGRIERGRVRIATPTLLELGYSAKSGDDWRHVHERSPVGAMPIESATPLIESRAIEVQGVLARRGQHRAPSIPDLLVAATAELSGLTVLHCDKGFELIASVTGQETEHLRLGHSAGS